MDKILDFLKRRPSSTREVRYGNITTFPESDGFSHNAGEAKLQKRLDFYDALVSLFPEGKVYYPGSGADPIPFQVFGDRVVYGSLNEANYLEGLKQKKTKQFQSYEKVIERTENLDTLQSVYADVRSSPFPDKTFRIVILNDIPLKFDEIVIVELKRLLEDGGIIVYEDNSKTLPEIDQDVDALIGLGLTPHDLDKRGGLTHISYFGFGKIKAFNEDGTRIMNGLSRLQFLEKLQNGEPVKMRGHQFRVFQKP